MGKERIESRTIMWAAGVEASPAGQWLGAESDRAGRVKVGPDAWKNMKIFAIPDFDDMRIYKARRLSGNWPPKAHEILLERDVVREWEDGARTDNLEELSPVSTVHR